MTRFGILYDTDEYCDIFSHYEDWTEGAVREELKGLAFDYKAMYEADGYKCATFEVDDDGGSAYLEFEKSDNDWFYISLELVTKSADAWLDLDGREV